MLAGNKRLGAREPGGQGRKIGTPLHLGVMGAAVGTALSKIPASKGARLVYFDGRFQETTIYDGQKVQSGNALQGPAIIEQRESTTVVLPGQQAVKGGQGEALISAATR